MSRTETPPKEHVRCAIYTRKSVAEGLDQEFNSLDAQREAGEAYIASQKHEGWVCLPQQYNDGGFSGGNMERPGLKRLLDDIEAGDVDCIVVYKIDRLSRSLLDFARIMEVLGRKRVQFVSVTQQFNTGNSMGRLMLNVLMSFAEFEREMISERTRDKLAAARRKGKWTGGAPPLGYDVDFEKTRLVVNAREARRVGKIFDLYLEHQSLLSVVEALRQRGWMNKKRITKKGKERGGRPFDKNSLHRLLTSVTYLGKVKYEGEIYEGEQEAIIDPGVWRRAQEVLRRNGRGGGKEVRNKHGALLKGLLYCESCDTAMIHTYTAKGKNKRYRYYVCTNAQKNGWQTCPTKSLSAGDIEAFVVEQVRGIGRDPALVAETWKQAGAQTVERIAELENELGICAKDLRRDEAEVARLSVAEAAEPTAARLADLHERIRATQRRAAMHQEEMATLQRARVSEYELVAALKRFDPVWEELTPSEQARLIKLLIERVGYDGAEGNISLTFRPAGIKALAGEAEI